MWERTGGCIGRAWGLCGAVCALHGLCDQVWGGCGGSVRRCGATVGQGAARESDLVLGLCGRAWGQCGEVGTVREG